jgi:hypothetical protein
MGGVRGYGSALSGAFNVVDGPSATYRNVVDGPFTA